MTIGQMDSWPLSASMQALTKVGYHKVDPGLMEELAARVPVIRNELTGNACASLPLPPCHQHFTPLSQQWVLQQPPQTVAGVCRP